MVELIGNEITYLFPGELIVTREALKINTVLGSCVSVCLYDPVKRIAGINHYLLPVNTKDDPNQFKYGDTSLEYMFKGVMSLGANMNNLSVHVFGGSSMFANATHSYNIGRQNIEVAMAFLKQKELTIKINDTGGNIGRKIVFDTSAGIISSNFLKGKQV